MFDKLIDIIIACWHRICPLEIIEAYNTGVVLRVGCYHRTLAPGLHWKWPVIEDIVSVLTCVTTMPLAAQTLTTKDGAGVVVAAVVKYQITKPEPYVTDIWDQKDVLADVTMGAVRAAVSESTWQELTTAPPEDKIRKAVRSVVNRYGFDVQSVTFTDIGRMRSIRLIQGQRAD